MHSGSGNHRKKIKAQIDAIGRNEYSQLIALRRHHLPAEGDSPESLAMAAWLDNHYWESMSTAINNGIVRAFKG
ncbi:DUF6890 family protein [Hafnia sp.]|uniref:DUF6890 family protein n=1 Tax=Hafnia sp. TaxID=1873498 RepID=UPI003FA5659A